MQYKVYKIDGKVYVDLSPWVEKYEGVIDYDFKDKYILIEHFEEFNEVPKGTFLNKIKFKDET